MALHTYRCSHCNRERQLMISGRRPHKSIPCVCGKCEGKARMHKLNRTVKIRVANWPEWCVPSASDEMNNMLHSAWKKETWKVD